jgi:hypothetical protein
MSKAYDKVEWAFVVGMTSKIGFAESSISLLMMCMTMV